MCKSISLFATRAWVLVIFLFPFVAFGITVYPDGSGDYSTIQAAVTAAEYEDIIYLESGIYKGQGNRDIEVNKKISIIGNGEVVMDCESTAEQEHFGLKVDEDFVLENVKIINSQCAIDAKHCQLQILNCQFSFNAAVIRALRIYGKFRIARSKFSNNDDVFDLYDSNNVTISRCIVDGVSSSIIKARDCSLKVLNSLFEDCIWMPFHLYGGQYHFIGCIIAKNQSSRLDYGIITSYESDLEFINCVIADNKATEDGSILNYVPAEGNRARF